MCKLGMTVLGLGMLLLLSSVGYSQAFINPPCSAAGSILTVKNTKVGSYEYVTFRLKRPLKSNYGYSVTTVSGPTFTEDPSGNTITVAGSQFKKIRFKGIYWTCPISQSFSLPKPIIKGIKRIKQYEGIVEYVIGYASPATHYDTHYTFNAAGLIRKVVIRFKP